MPGGGVDSERATAPLRMALGLVPVAVAIGAFVLVQAADWEWYTAWLILAGLGALAAAAGVLMTSLRAFQAMMDCVTEGLGWVAKWLVPVLVVLAFAKVLFRYVGRWQNERIVDIALLDQWQLHLFGYIFLLSLPYVLKNGINVRVDFLFQNYPVKVKAAIDFVGHIIGLIPFCLLAIWTTWDKTSTSLWRNARPRGSRPWQFWRVWEPYEGTPGGLPPGPVLLTMTASFVLLLLQTFAELVKLFDVLAGKRSGASELVASDEQPLRVE